MQQLNEQTATPILAEYMRCTGYPWSIWDKAANGRFARRGLDAIRRAHIWWLLRLPTGDVVRGYQYIAGMTNTSHVTVMYGVARHERWIRERRA